MSSFKGKTLLITGGTGSFGLAWYVKQKGKVAIHIGGATQLLLVTVSS